MHRAPVRGLVGKRQSGWFCRANRHGGGEDHDAERQRAGHAVIIGYAITLLSRALIESTQFRTTP
jgi:hypothetical protein